MAEAANKHSRQRSSASYVQINISLPPETAAGFKARCTAEGISMRSEIIRFMGGGISPKETPLPIATRRERKKALKTIVLCLERITKAEAQYAENIPDNLKNGAAYEAATETTDALEEALCLLKEAYQ